VWEKKSKGDTIGASRCATCQKNGQAHRQHDARHTKFEVKRTQNRSKTDTQLKEKLASFLAISRGKRSDGRYDTK